MPAFWRQTIVRVRAALAPDGYGTPDAKRDWEHAVETTIDGVLVTPVSTAEQGPVREAASTRMQIYAPAGTDLLAGDRVQFEGQLYDMVGDGRAWPSATGLLDHVEATVERHVG